MKPKLSFFLGCLWASFALASPSIAPPLQPFTLDVQNLPMKQLAQPCQASKGLCPPNAQALQDHYLVDPSGYRETCTRSSSSSSTPSASTPSPSNTQQGASITSSGSSSQPSSSQQKNSTSSSTIVKPMNQFN